MALSRLERVGLERTDLHAAALCGVDPTAFCFEPEREQTEEEMFAAFTMLVGIDENGSSSSDGQPGVKREAAAVARAEAEGCGSQGESRGSEAGCGSGEIDGTEADGQAGSAD